MPPAFPHFHVHDFTDIAADYNDTLLLGNGASIAIDPCFTYASLLQYARDRGLITQDVQAVFDHFDTSDFELVMRMLRHAYHVNRALRVDESVTEPAYGHIKHALIEAVRSTHFAHELVLPHVAALYGFMSRYDTVLSLNYDLSVYWSMLKGNEAFGGTWFKDCWVHGAFDGEWTRFREPMRGVSGATLVFYPHGNLALASSLTGGEEKLSVDSDHGSLLDRVIREWAEGDRLPLFVSEGETAQKEAAISRSGYLSTVYNDVMTDLGESVTIYGWALGEQDEHIVRRVCAPRVQRIAISVYRGGRTDKELQLSLAMLLLRVRRYNAEARVAFFDSESAGCWHRYTPDDTNT